MQFWKHRGFTSPTDAGMITLPNNVQLANVEFPIVLIPSCRTTERRFVHPKKPKLPIEWTFLCIEMCSSPIQALNEQSSINPRFGGSTIVQRCIQFSKQDSLILLTVSAPVKSTHSSAEQSMNVFLAT
jgi:hypothetical protein